MPKQSKVEVLKMNKGKEKEEMINCFCKNIRNFFNDYILIELPNDVNAWIAGGALRDFFLYGYIKTGTDIDIFTNSQENYDKIKNELLLYYDEIMETDFALTLVDKDDNEKILQIIKKFHKDPQECISRFDFTCCCAYIGQVAAAVTKEIIWDAANEFYDDNYNRNLRILKLNEKPAVTLTRIKKYCKDKGYHISDFEKKELVNAYINGQYQLEELVIEYEGLKVV